MGWGGVGAGQWDSPEANIRVASRRIIQVEMLGEGIIEELTLVVFECPVNCG